MQSGTSCPLTHLGFVSTSGPFFLLIARLRGKAASASPNPTISCVFGCSPSRQDQERSHFLTPRMMVIDNDRTAALGSRRHSERKGWIL